MLIFVGEDLEILSIASGREESAFKAPAVTSVFLNEGIKGAHGNGLAEILEETPGFYIEEKEAGPEVYLRGVSGSALFLFDTVSYGSAVTRSSSLAGRELSLASAKRIEIIRGPGSVLWGSDAFGGIVNVVPLNGRDFQGVETGVDFESPGDVIGAHLKVGKDWGNATGFFSLAAREGEIDDRDANVLRFFGGDGPTPVEPEERFGSETPGESFFMDMVSVVEWMDWLSVTARISANKREFVRADSDQSHAWLETRENPSSMIKLEGRRRLTADSELRFSGYLADSGTESGIIDMEYEQDEKVLFGEAVFETSLFSHNGLFTIGSSIRKESVDNAPVWQAYMPDFLTEENRFQKPRVEFTDYTIDVQSVFGQYTHQFGPFDIYAGGRYDNYNIFTNKVSCNFGGVWSPSTAWVYKVLWGTAYRTPLASQVGMEDDPDPEMVRSLNLQAGFRPERDTHFIVTLFFNEIDNHVLEDVYAGYGLSTPNSQTLQGIEIEAGTSLFKSLTLDASLTLLDNSGNDEVYLYNDYTFINNDGDIIKHYAELEYGYNPGPDTLFCLTARWSPGDDFIVSGKLTYHSDTQLYYVPDEAFKKIDGYWMFDAGIRFQDMFTKGMDMELYVENLFDHNYEVPGTYSSLSGTPLKFGMEISWRW